MCVYVCVVHTTRIKNTYKSARRVTRQQPLLRPSLTHVVEVEVALEVDVANVQPIKVVAAPMVGGLPKAQPLQPRVTNQDVRMRTTDNRGPASYVQPPHAWRRVSGPQAHAQCLSTRLRTGLTQTPNATTGRKRQKLRAPGTMPRVCQLACQAGLSLR